MKLLLNIFVLAAAIAFLNNCNTTDPPPPPPNGEKPTLELTLEDVSCTEAWINLTTANLQLPSTLTLKQINPIGDTLSKVSILNTQDSLLYIDSLLPNQTYSFHTTIQSSNHTSNELSVATMDTTSHIFNYQTFELGEPITGNSSILYDIALIDANNIWAVGEIFIADSLGQSDPYGIAHWDGQNWNLLKLQYTSPLGGEFVLSNIRGILYMNSSEIWFAAGSIFRWDGVSSNAQLIFSRLDLSDPNGSIENLWGNSSTYMYGVGNKGTIVVFNGQTWQQIPSGTEFPLIDIYSKDGSDIYAAGINVSAVEGVVLKGTGNQFSVMINSEIIDESELFEKLYGDLASVWIDELGTLYAGGNLLYRYKNNEWNYVTSLPENYIGGNPGSYYRGALSSIRGNASNDYIIAGERNTLRHFNGVTWEQIGLPYNPSSPIGWAKVVQKGSTAVAVGGKGSYAFIILLTR